MIKRIIFTLAAALLFASPASAFTLANLTITTAQTAQAGAGACAGASATCKYTDLQVREGSTDSVTIQCNFTYGSGGTSADAYVQTSIDGGTNWIDVAECGFTTSSARKLYNISGLTPITSPYTPGDGVLTANTSHDGILGTRFRVKYTTVGTYAGNTTLAVDIDTNRARMIVQT